MNYFHLFTFWIMNNDCNERVPQYYMTTIMDTIYNGQYIAIEDIKNLNITWLQWRNQLIFNIGYNFNLLDLAQVHFTFDLYGF